MTFAALVPSASSAARRAPRLAIRSLLVVCAAAALASCSVFDDFNPFGAEKYKMVIEPDVPASKVYDQGLAKLANGAPADAAKKFTDLGTQFPDSDWARKGLLMTTYAQFQGGDYENAEQSAQRYVKLYPKSTEAAYALYLEASAYYNQIPDVSRDQERAAKALLAFQQVVKDYPNSEYVSASAPCSPAIRRRGTRKRPSIASPKLIWGSASPTRRKRPRRCSATTSPTGNGTRTPTAF
jgi:outer membrane protein assembly factor BamD